MPGFDHTKDSVQSHDLFASVLSVLKEKEEDEQRKDGINQTNEFDVKDDARGSDSGINNNNLRRQSGLVQTSVTRCFSGQHIDSHLVALQEKLVTTYGHVGHEALADSSFSVFVSEDRQGMIIYKAMSGVAVIMGDPITSDEMGFMDEDGTQTRAPHIGRIFSQFDLFCREQKLTMAFLGVSLPTIRFAETQGWTKMAYAVDQSIFPSDLYFLHQLAAYDKVPLVRKLIEDGTVKIKVWSPLLEQNEDLYQALKTIWQRRDTDQKSPRLAHLHCCPFDRPNLYYFIYTTDSKGRPNSYAALRILGVNRGFHLESIETAILLYLSAPGAFHALQIATLCFATVGRCQALTTGVIPIPYLTNIHGLNFATAKLCKTVYKCVVEDLLDNDFEEDLECWKKFGLRVDYRNMYLVFPSGAGRRKWKAIAEVMNLDVKWLHFRWVCQIERKPGQGKMMRIMKMAPAKMLGWLLK